MRIGIHASGAGGLVHLPDRAHDLGAEIFQFFSRSPMGGPAPVITSTVAATFRERVAAHGIAATYIHTPYFINFASSKKGIARYSIEVLRGELDRGTQLGVTGVITHLGSAKDLGLEAALDQTARGIAQALSGYDGSTMLLLEIAAGSGQIIGGQFEQLATILQHPSLRDADGLGGCCFDTAHAFASGYGLQTAPEIAETLAKFDATIGLDRLQVVHANDSKVDRGAHSDRHWHIGEGKIGLPAFRALAANPTLQKLDWILETPKDKGDALDRKNLATLKALRK